MSKTKKTTQSAPTAPTSSQASEVETESPTESLDELVAAFWRARRDGHSQNEASALGRIRAIAPTWGSSIA